VSQMVKPFDMYYVAEVLSDILSRERGYQLKIVLTPKVICETNKKPCDKKINESA
jgi:hypothetical protein